MKQVHASYSFVASTKTITLTGLNIDQDQLLLIVNATRGVQYFNFADSSLRAAVTPGSNTSVVLTDASTTGHANGDALVIYYDDQVTSQAVSGTVTANPGTGAFTVSGTVGLDNASLVALENITVTVGSSVALAAGSAQVGSVTVANFPSTQTIAGTVTANGGNFLNADNSYVNRDSAQNLVLLGALSYEATPTRSEIQALQTDALNKLLTKSYTTWEDNNSGGQARSVGQYYPLPVQVVSQPSVTIGSLPAISGTVTANNPNGALTTRFGSVTTANTAQITSAVTNTSRKYLLAQNISAGTVTIGIGFSPTTTQGIQLAAGAGLTFDAFCPTGAIYWLGAVTGANYCLIEG